MFNKFDINNKVLEASEAVMTSLAPVFDSINKTTEYNSQKVLAAFIKHKISEQHFNPTTGYGYGDKGRDVMDMVFADVFEAQDALVRLSIASGTHALTIALFGILRPSDTMLCITGTPYDTIHDVIGIKGSGKGSLKDFGINYNQIDLTDDGLIDYTSIEEYLKISNNKLKLVYIQKSRGYTLRPSLLNKDIFKISSLIKSYNKDIIIMVDNCYGEFVQKNEPLSCGTDIIAGSLIKNPGGGVAPCGGYIAGRADLIELCSYRLTTPSTGREIGASLGHNKELYMGLINAPLVVGESLKSAAFAGELLRYFGFESTPALTEPRGDIIQSINLNNDKNLINFCIGLQKGSVIDSFVTPAPWNMPGYDDKVIMSCGAFINGSSIELSADAPLREPFAVWLQGGVNFYTAKIGIMYACSDLLNNL